MQCAYIHSTLQGVHCTLYTVQPGWCRDSTRLILFNIKPVHYIYMYTPSYPLYNVHLYTVQPGWCRDSTRLIVLNIKPVYYICIHSTLPAVHTVHSTLYTVQPGCHYSTCFIVFNIKPVHIYTGYPTSFRIFHGSKLEMLGTN